MEKKTKIVLLLGLMITVTAAVIIFIAASENSGNSGNLNKKRVIPTQFKRPTSVKPYKPNRPNKIEKPCWNISLK